MERADGEKVGGCENDQGNNESEEEREESVEMFLPLRRVDPMGHALVERLLKWALSHVKYDHLYRDQRKSRVKFTDYTKSTYTHYGEVIQDQLCQRL